MILILSFIMAPPLGFGQVITTSFMGNAIDMEQCDRNSGHQAHI